MTSLPDVGTSPLDVAVGALPDRSIAGDDTLSAPDRDPPPLDLLEPQRGLLRLGHHVLLEKLGQGGMGVVFAAFDTKLDRKVAIKLLRSPDGEQSRVRMTREARAMARVSHPNVVQVYEIGEHEQLTFLVMEFVDGVTLTTWLAEQTRTPREILATFVAAGRGLAAAHQKELVHRDFKPDNVMIRRDGQVLVMDFGLARGDPRPEPEPRSSPSGLALVPTSAPDSKQTHADTLIGTPSYMAPEQFAGLETDARSDQFSFCVALWEALYQQRPFHGENMAALAMAVGEGRLTQPERSDVPAWLRRVLERGLAPSPTRRWPTMVELLEALGRDPSRRRRGFMLGAGLVALTGLLLAGGLVWREREQGLVIRGCEAVGTAIEADWNAEVATRLERAFVATRAGFAPSAWAHTRPWLDDYARRWSELRTQTCLESQVEHTRDPDSHDSVVDCLDEQRTTFRGLLAAWADADRRTVTGATVAAAGLVPLSTCTSALLAARARAPASLRVEITALRAALGRVRPLQLAGAYDPGLAQAREILAEADRLGWRPLQAEASLMVGNLLAALGKYEEARDARQQAFFHALAGGDDSSMLAAATELTHNVGYLLAQHEQGRRWGTIGEMLVERLGLAGSLQESTLIASIGGVLTIAGSYDQALTYFRRALGRKEALLGPGHPTVARMFNSIGVVLYNHGDSAEAVANFRRSLSLEEAALGPEHPDIAHSLNNLAAVLGGRGMIDEALEYHHRALTLRIASLGEDHPDVGMSLGNIGVLLAQQGDYEGALEHERRALAIFEVKLGPDHPEVAVTHAALGEIHLKQRALDKALQSYQSAFAIRAKAFGPDHPEIGRAHHDIGGVQLERGAYSLALVAFGKALAIREAALGRDNFEVGRTLVGLGRAQIELGERAAARENLLRAVAICERGSEPSVLAEARAQLARLDTAR